MTLLRMVLSMLICANYVSAQSTLPQELEGEQYGFDGPYAAFFKLPQTGGDIARARIILNNTLDENQTPDNRVSIEWMTKQVSSGGSGIWEFCEQDISTTFKPTAICAGNATTREIYVAGWLENSSETIIEKWRFIQAPQGAGEGFEKPLVTKTIILQCNSIQPPSSIACQPYSNELWIMEWPMTFPKRLISFDLGSTSPPCGVLNLLYDDSNPTHQQMYPNMTNYRTIISGTHPAAGWLAYFTASPHWAGPTLMKTVVPIMVAIDAGNDGIIDSLSDSTYSVFFNQYPFSEWNESFGN